MKTLWIMIALILVFSLAPGQSKFLRESKRIEKKGERIKVGMTTDEVKKILGNPKSVSGGFPEIEHGSITLDSPSFAGQINNSTWLYYEKMFSYRELESNPKADYYLNYLRVSEKMYKEYESLENIHYYKGDIVLPYLAEHYKGLGDGQYTVSPKDTVASYYETHPARMLNVILQPMIAVIFDRGTTVVASCRVFYVVIEQYYEEADGPKIKGVK